MPTGKYRSGYRFIRGIGELSVPAGPGGFGAAGNGLLNNLVSFWKLDEASGNAADAHGTNTLTDNNTVTNATGLVYATARQFTAANSEYLSIVDNASLSTGDIDFTVAAWVYWDTLGANRPVVMKDDAATVPGFREYALLFIQATNRIRFFVSDGTNVVGNVAADTLGVPGTNTWYFIVAWHSASGNTVNISVNNGDVDSVATSGSPADTPQPMNIGARPEQPEYNAGRIGPVMFWKAVLTAAQRTALYAGGAGLPYASFTA